MITAIISFLLLEKAPFFHYCILIYFKIDGDIRTAVPKVESSRTEISDSDTLRLLMIHEKKSAAPLVPSGRVSDDNTTSDSDDEDQNKPSTSAGGGIGKQQHCFTESQLRSPSQWASGGYIQHLIPTTRASEHSWYDFESNW